MSKMKFPQRWITLQEPPRYLRADGVSAMDPDILVAFIEDGGKADNGGDSVWIIFNGDPRLQVATVIGLGKDRTRAARLSQ